MGTLEKNKLFVKFLGWKIKQNGFDVEIPPNLYTPTLSELESGKYYWTMCITDLDFSDEYRYIMEVVNAIEKVQTHLEFNICKKYVNIKYYIVNENKYWDVSIMVNENKTKISALNDICYQFISFYDKL